MDPSSSTRSATIPPPHPTPIIYGEDAADPYVRQSFTPASQAQILRAVQRDSSQVHRLSELVSELIRTISGTRWLAHKQSIIDLCIRGVYLSLTLGRGQQTLGEEYTDILPYTARSRGFPSKLRRLLTIIFLLLPSILASPIIPPPATSSNELSHTRLQRLRTRLKDFLDSPFGQLLPELHMMAFLYGGRFLEFGRRLTGLSYISTIPRRTGSSPPASYEPLAILMLLPFLTRLLRARQASISASNSTPSTSYPLAEKIPESKSIIPPISPPLTPLLTPTETVLLEKNNQYDTPNTYLTPEALESPDRQCTLCLEPRGTGEGSGGTVAVTECGHVFCWGCLGGLEKAECPLCRQTLRMERLTPAYNL